MAVIDSLLVALDERQIAQRIGLRHDEARMRYQLRRNTVANFDEFSDIIADYYNHHFTKCVSGGGSLLRSEAAGRAKEALEKEYRRRDGDIVTAFNDAHDGTNGGLRVVLDLLAEAKRLSGGTPVILITGHGNEASILQRVASTEDRSVHIAQLSP
jgi:hypothetical protein